MKTEKKYVNAHFRDATTISTRCRRRGFWTNDRKEAVWLLGRGRNVEITVDQSSSSPGKMVKNKANAPGLGDRHATGTSHEDGVRNHILVRGKI